MEDDIWGGRPWDSDPSITPSMGLGTSFLGCVTLRTDVSISIGHQFNISKLEESSPLRKFLVSHFHSGPLGFPSFAAFQDRFFWLIESPSLSRQDLSACRPLGRAASHSSQSQYKFRRITPRPLLNSSGQGITLHRSKSHISISPVISQPARKLSQLYRPSPYVLTKLIALPFKVDSLSLSDKRICHHHHYQLIPSATMPQCTHDYKSIKSPNNILLWHCSICHSGPHWFIQQCSICKKKTCSVHAQKDVQS